MTSLQRYDNNTSRQKDTTMMDKFYKFARAITLAPVIAMISLTATAIFRPSDPEKNIMFIEYKEPRS